MGEWFIFGCVCVLLVVVPLVKGGNSEGVRSLTVCVAIAACCIQFRISISKGSRVYPWVLVWIVVAILTTLQVFPGVGNLVSSLSAIACIKCENSSITGSLVDTLSYSAVFTAYWGIAWVVSNMTKYRVNLLALLLLILGFSQALYGVVSFVSGQVTILGIWDKEHYRGVATGSFVNRNHFSGFLELTWCFGLALLLSISADRKNSLMTYSMMICYSLVLGVGVLSSSSRLGMLSAIIGVVVLMVLSQRKKIKQLESKSNAKAICVAVFVVIYAMVWYGLGELIERSFHLVNDGRFLIWESLAAYPVSVWLFGIGAGNFMDAYKLIRDINMQGGVFAELHSDILEFVLNFGVVGAGCIMASILVWFVKLKPRNWGLLQLGALSAVIAMMVHSFGDFNLQIPGVAVVFWAMVGVIMNDNLADVPDGRRKS